MASSPSKLSLDCKTHMALKSFGGQNSDQNYKVEEIISQLEEERLKIDAFKRELPLCMQLLTNAMEASRQQLEVLKVNQGTRPVLEEFIPIKHSTYESFSAEKETKITDNKADWMTSAQLWSQASEGTKQQATTIITSLPTEAVDNIGFSMNPSLVLNHNNKQGNHNGGGGGGAFLPFLKERNSSQISALRALPELALASAEKEIEDKKCEDPCLKMENSSKGGTDGMVVDQGKGPSHAQNTTTAAAATTQTHRKARRCWSPELHRRFVNALQMLGGSQVATPKQIRELMKVDGLTNDEVKSHLQKYRLHTRRPSPSPQSGAPPPQLVVLGGIWVPPEYATAGAPTLYSAHPNSLPQEFYTAAPPQQLLPPPHPPHQNALHHHHQLMHVYKTAPQRQSSPEYDVQGGSESIEDGKSESSSWKGESGENEGERKGLQYEESNGSEITLKF
ncbi:hypothetical protein TanjilG_18536 [Lupinus angustifolius]|uniref:HTH myb-type domain-containing protein n=1 Tax=Lupinus angustifolius TaxID=3871 RepID=A0A4P1RXH8_LUPAN|nr:PREDICTED: myb family transcription factor EFM-like [Lupinus angustifolius]OIW19726.1 hypothetical protein TanjilG_18536 [Lupinus angustifolius]